MIVIAPMSMESEEVKYLFGLSSVEVSLALLVPVDGVGFDLVASGPLGVWTEVLSCLLAAAVLCLSTF